MSGVKEEEHESLTMMSEEDLDEAVGQATEDLANTHINGSAGEVAVGVAHEADVENNGVSGSANEPAVSQEAPPKQQDQEQHQIEENGKSEPKAGKKCLDS